LSPPPPPSPKPGHPVRSTQVPTPSCVATNFHVRLSPRERGCTLAHHVRARATHTRMCMVTNAGRSWRRLGFAAGLSDVDVLTASVPSDAGRARTQCSYRAQETRTARRRTHVRAFDSDSATTGNSQYADVVGCPGHAGRVNPPPPSMPGRATRTLIVHPNCWLY
jgi:hypothetical protein